MRNLAAGSDDNRRMALLPRRGVDSPLGREQTAPKPLQRNVRLSAETGQKHGLHAPLPRIRRRNSISLRTGAARFAGRDGRTDGIPVRK